MTKEQPLSQRHCQACEGGVAPLDRAEAEDYLRQLDDGWELAGDGKSIRREFRFKGFGRTLQFVNALGWIAEQQGHHPDLQVGYGRCEVSYATHSIGGLSANDFICAARIDQLLQE